jgi:hypothetical protein
MEHEGKECIVNDKLGEIEFARDKTFELDIDGSLWIEVTYPKESSVGITYGFTSTGEPVRTLVSKDTELKSFTRGSEQELSIDGLVQHLNSRSDRWSIYSMTVVSKDSSWLRATKFAVSCFSN